MTNKQGTQMQFAQALEIVEEVKANNRLPGLLETLQFMEVPSNREELTGAELRAYRVVFNEMRKLFIKE
jgi:hypothetical protein